MSVHYKFKSTLDYDTVSFDGLHISVADLKKAIFHQKRIGKNTDFDLQITNAQTKEDYVDDNALIAKNTSLIVARVPITVQQKKSWDRSELQTFGNPKDEASLGHAVDLTRLDGSEEDKIRAMMTQSTQDYDPSNYMKIRGANQSGDLPPNYLCYKCHQPGHWIKNCPLGTNQEPIEIKKSTGIPRSFMVPVEGPLVPGAMMTPTGQYAVPAIDHQAYKEGKKERPPFFQDPEPAVKKPEIPEDLLCNICKDLLTDAVMIPCCGNSFCDECIRTFLLESEEHECPDCSEKDVSPETLIPNRFLRNAVMTFKNETGYAKQRNYRINTQKAQSSQPKETVEKKSEVVSASGDAEVSKEVPVAITTTVPSSQVETVAVHKPTPPQPTIKTDECITPMNVDDNTSTISPPPPGTEPPLPILSLISKASDKKSESSTIEKKDLYESEETKSFRDSRACFNKENNRERSGEKLRKIENPKSTSRRRSVSPRHSHHSDYAPHNQSSIPHVTSSGKGYQSSSNFSRYSSNIHYDSDIHRSNEDRSGTPTVDEPHLHSHGNVHQSVMLYPPGEDRLSALPPPSYNQPPPIPPPPPPHNAPLLPDPYMTQRMPIYNHQQGGHYGMNRYDRPQFSQSGFRGQAPRNYNGPPRLMRGMHHSMSYRGIQPPPPGLGRNYHNGNPTGVIDDPLEAFERMLREKDERDRRLGKHRRRSRSHSRSRSYTRSRSRSFTRRSPLSSRMSRSRSPALKRRSSRTPLSLRQRSRTPKRRSRSGSFTISRSRSYSRSQSPRGVVIKSRERDRERDRDFPVRYKSPLRSPTRFQRDRDRDSARSHESRERHGSYYADVLSNDCVAKNRDRDMCMNKDRPNPRYPRNVPLHHGNVHPKSLPLHGGGGNHPPMIPSSGPTSERKDYYDSYSRYPGSSERLNSPIRDTHQKRIDEVAPPGTEGYYDLPPPGVDYPEKSIKDDRDRFRLGAEQDNHQREHTKDSIDNRDRVQIRDERLIKEFDDRLRDEKPRRYSDRDHDRERDKEKDDRDRLARERDERMREKDVREKRDDKYTRDRRDDDRFNEKREHERERFRDDRDRHKFEDRNRNRDKERKDRDYELPKERDRPDRYEKYLPDRRKIKKSASPYPQRSSRPEVKPVSPERLKKKEKVEMRSEEKKKEKKIKDKKKKKDSEEKEKKKKKKKEKKAASKETGPLRTPSDAEKEPDAVDVVPNPARIEEPKMAHTSTFKNITVITGTSSSSFNSEFDNKSLMINPEPPEPTKNLAQSEMKSEFGINPPNPNFKPIPELKPELKPINRLYSGIDDAEINSMPDDYNLMTNPVYKSENDDNNESDDKTMSTEADSTSPEKSASSKYESRVNLKKDEQLLAPMPELSKWERDDNTDKIDPVPNPMSTRVNEHVEESKATKVVTSEVIKRAENAIFQKAINAIRPIEIKKISENRKVLYQNPEPKVLELDLNLDTRKNVNVTINVGKNERNVEITEMNKKGKLDRSKFRISTEAYSPTRVSVKERLGDKIDDDKDKKITIYKTFDRRDHKGDTLAKTKSPKFGAEKNHSPVGEQNMTVDVKNDCERKVILTEHPDRDKSDRFHDKGHSRIDNYGGAENKDSEDKGIELSRDKRDSRRNHTPPGSISRSSVDDSMNPLKRRKEDNEKKDEKKIRSDKKRKKEHRSRSKSKERKKRKDKKHKKDKSAEKKQKYKEVSAKYARTDDADNADTFSGSQSPVKKQRKNSKHILERKRSALDEASFEPDYSAADTESDSEDTKIVQKKPKLEEPKFSSDKEVDVKVVKRKTKSTSSDDNSSSSGSSSSESVSSEDSHKKRRKKHKKHKKHKSSKKSSSSDSDSDSDYTDSSSNDEKYKKKIKKSRSKNKQAKKKKKSKHK